MSVRARRARGCSTPGDDRLETRRVCGQALAVPAGARGAVGRVCVFDRAAGSGIGAGDGLGAGASSFACKARRRARPHAGRTPAATRRRSSRARPAGCAAVSSRAVRTSASPDRRPRSAPGSRASAASSPTLRLERQHRRCPPEGHRRSPSIAKRVASRPIRSGSAGTANESDVEDTSRPTLANIRSWAICSRQSGRKVGDVGIPTVREGSVVGVSSHDRRALSATGAVRDRRPRWREAERGRTVATHSARKPPGGHQHETAPEGTDDAELWEAFQRHATTLALMLDEPRDHGNQLLAWLRRGRRSPTRPETKDRYQAESRTRLKPSRPARLQRTCANRPTTSAVTAPEDRVTPNCGKLSRA